MISVSVDIDPYGISELRRPVCNMKIVNDGTGTDEYGNYRVEYYSDDGTRETAQVKEFCRDLGALALVERAIYMLRFEEAKR